MVLLGLSALGFTFRLAPFSLLQLSPRDVAWEDGQTAAMEAPLPRVVEHAPVTARTRLATVEDALAQLAAEHSSLTRMRADLAARQRWALAAGIMPSPELGVEQMQLQSAVRELDARARAVAGERAALQGDRMLRDQHDWEAMKMQAVDEAQALQGPAGSSGLKLSSEELRDGKRILKHVRARVDAATSVGLGASTQASSSQAALETTAKLTSKMLSKRHLILNAGVKGDAVSKRPPMKAGKVQQLAKNRAKPRRTSKLQKATSKKTRPNELKPVFDFHFDGFGMKLSGAVQVSWAGLGPFACYVDLR